MYWKKCEQMIESSLSGVKWGTILLWEGQRNVSVDSQNIYCVNLMWNLNFCPRTDAMKMWHMYDKMTLIKTKTTTVTTATEMGRNQNINLKVDLQVLVKAHTSRQMQSIMRQSCHRPWSPATTPPHHQVSDKKFDRTGAGGKLAFVSQWLTECADGALKTKFLLPWSF